MITNKEVIDKLEEYYLKQDPKLIARALAGCVIDYNRLLNYDQMDENEKFNFTLRLKNNVASLRNFLQNAEVEGEFKLFTINS